MTDYFLRRHKHNLLLKRVLNKLPDEALDEQERAAKQRLAEMPDVTILHLIYQQMAYEGHAKDYEFSAVSMREHWHAGYRDTLRTLRHKDWLAMPGGDGGILVHDVHRLDD